MSISDCQWIAVQFPGWRNFSIVAWRNGPKDRRLRRIIFRVREINDRRAWFGIGPVKRRDTAYFEAIEHAGGWARLPMLTSVYHYGETVWDFGGCRYGFHNWLNQCRGVLILRESEQMNHEIPKE